MQEDDEHTKLPVTEDDVDTEELPPLVAPPDGGWGWVIVFASFMCNVVVDGIIFSFGVFLTELTTTFNESKSKVAWIGSINAGTYLIVGPLVSALANTYGCRPVIIMGSIIAAIGFVLSAFATDIVFLFVTYGILGGTGFGFIFLPAIVTVGFYFERKRSFATGIAVCGSGIGTFLFAPVTRLLIDSFGWRGTMLILAGISLHCIAFGFLFRPLGPPKPNPRSKSRQKPLLLRIKEAREALHRCDSEESVAIDDNLIDRKNGVGRISTSQRSSIVGNTSASTCASGSTLQVAGFNVPNQTTSFVSPTCSHGSLPPPYNEVVNDDIASYLNNNSLKVPRQPSLEKIAVLRNQQNNNRRLSKINKEEALRPFYRQDILFSASLIRLPEFRSQPDIEHYHFSIIRIPEHNEETENSIWRRCGCSPAMIDTFRQMLDFSLLFRPTFLVLAISGFLTMIGFFVPFMYLVDRAGMNGIPPEKGAFILSVIGITNTVGRLFSGWVCDRPEVKTLVINNTALVVGGVCTVLNPLLNTYSLLLAYAAIFGFSIACFAALRSVITAEILGVEKLTNAFGLLLLFQGLASFIGAPLAGMFYDITGSYDASFYIAGSVIALSGIMCVPLPFISRWENSREEKRQGLMSSNSFSNPHSVGKQTANDSATCV
ncbi:monocarboxylate transporter 12-like isoform X2 [Limulus polyphemus]|nr:monocarboxylate transporter 12-like isoform X2 [Limulus polyphemus]XP_022251800.1 monocarboxylate transporter 12-like isoform X2 [Limulus polyphemus]XP_022251806.1 monocarboxylate transporter 12-like isoform X2 [Limulus polyphemus]XP_022251809.1 monocarboxylate transporter 12-like isoform X2 [Limulus polyphemus]XP_022251814.1 monocarboxylate transporter 12-like isoform X2 [Limulus polyphemus]